MRIVEKRFDKLKLLTIIKPMKQKILNKIEELEKLKAEESIILNKIELGAKTLQLYEVLEWIEENPWLSIKTCHISNPSK